MIQNNNTQKWTSCVAGSLLLLLLPACTSEADLEGSQPLVVTAEIASTSPSTRAIGATNYDKRIFEEGDEIQISDGSKSVDYKKDKTNGWVPTTTGSGLKVTTPASTFSASYPKGFTSILEEQDQSYENFWKSNKLEAKGTTNVKLTNNQVNFTFMPVASKITISINYKSSGSSTTKYKDVTTTLTGGTTCGIRTGGSSSEVINMLRTSENVASDKHSFVCILYPGTWSFTLSVSRTPENSSTPESQEQTFTQPSYSFVAAKNYVYNFTSSDELILNKVEVEDFEAATDVPNDPVSAT